MKIVLKKLLFYGLFMLLVFLLTTPILKGIYFLLSASSITFTTPLIGAVKYFSAIFLLFFIIWKKAKLTTSGKKIIPIIMIVCIFGLLITTTYVNRTNEAGIVQQNLLKYNKKKWSEVAYIETRATTYKTIDIFGKKIEMRRTHGSGIHKRVIPTLEYRIYYKDGSSVNVWDKTDSLYQLHQLVKSKGIEVKHGDVHIADTFHIHIKGDEAKVKEILGITDKN